MGKTFGIVLAATLLACGGGKQESTTPDESGDSDIPPGEETAEESGGDVSPVDPNVVSNEQMAEVQRLLDRRRPAVSRCLAFAVDNQELPKNSRGKMVLQITVQPSGKADVQKLKTNLESKSLDDCVLGKVREIVFPELPQRYETTYTYGFEAL